MTKADNKQIEAAKAAMDKATPGPWAKYYAHVGKWYAIQVDIGKRTGKTPCVVTAGGFDGCGLSKKQQLANATILAAAPALVRRVQELEDWQDKALEWLRVDYDDCVSRRGALANWEKQKLEDYNGAIEELTALIEQAKGGHQ